MPGPPLSDIIGLREGIFDSTLMKSELLGYIPLFEFLFDIPLICLSKENRGFIFESVLRWEGLVWQKSIDNFGTLPGDSTRGFVLKFASNLVHVGCLVNASST
jgi:hypothetical protein